MLESKSNHYSTKWKEICSNNIKKNANCSEQQCKSSITLNQADIQQQTTTKPTGWAYKINVLTCKYMQIKSYTLAVKYSNILLDFQTARARIYPSVKCIGPMTLLCRPNPNRIEVPVCSSWYQRPPPPQTCFHVQLH